MKPFFLSLALAGAVISTGAFASDMGVSAEIGTTGLGLHLTVPVQTGLNARIGLNGANYNYTGSANNVDYDLKLKLASVDALLDYYPGASPFRLTAGAIYNGSKFDSHARPKGGASYTFNGTTYAVATAGTIDGNVDFRKFSPYLGIGYGNAIKDAGWSFTSDAGVMFAGSPRSTLTSNGCSAGPVICTQLASDVAVENGKLQDKLDNLRFYPVLRVGLAYRF